MKPTGIYVVPIGQVASFLGWTTSRARRATFLAPTRSADGTRLYDVDRVLALAMTLARITTHNEARERSKCRNLRRWAQGLRRWLRGTKATDEQRLRAVTRCAAIARTYQQAVRLGFDVMVASCGLRCALALIGTASMGLTTNARARHPHVPWRRVRALDALHENEDARLVRRGADVIVPLLRRLHLTTPTRTS